MSGVSTAGAAAAPVLVPANYVSARGGTFMTDAWLAGSNVGGASVTLLWAYGATDVSIVRADGSTVELIQDGNDLGSVTLPLFLEIGETLRAASVSGGSFGCCFELL